MASMTAVKATSAITLTGYDPVLPYDLPLPYDGGALGASMGTS